MYDHVATAAILDRVLMHQYLKDEVEIAKVVRKRQRALLLRRAGYGLLFGLSVLALLVGTHTLWIPYTSQPESIQPTPLATVESTPDTAMRAKETSQAVAGPIPEHTDHSSSTESDARLQLRLQSTLTTQPLIQTE